MPIINILTYLNTICPWCFTGHRSLQKAITLYRTTYPGGKNDTIVVRHVPFHLDQDAPEHGIPMSEAVVRKNGAERAGAIWTRLRRTGREYGIEFCDEGRSGRTRLSHQLVLGVGRERGWEVQERLVEEVYQMLFEKGGDVTCVDDLVKAAVAIRVQESDARRWTSDGGVGAEVDKLAVEARDAGVTACRLCM